jgi:hypothetical protein
VRPRRTPAPQHGPAVLVQSRCPAANSGSSDPGSSAYGSPPLRSMAPPPV